METLTPMAFAICTMLHVTCTTPEQLFFDSATAPLSDPYRYESLYGCVEGECEFEANEECVAVARRPLAPAGLNYMTYLCRPKRVVASIGRDPASQGDAM